MEDNAFNQQQIVAAPSHERWVYSGGETPICKLPDLLLVCKHIFIIHLICE
jgi:hypothetical protein